jgi:hypothetical protein
MSMINEHGDTAVFDMIDLDTMKVLSLGHVLTKREAEKRNQGLSLNGTSLRYVNRFESDISPV